ncbi:MAG: GTPase [Thermoplasmata archaeon]|nr:MAG: GTPase [Thermoplasmata archaeon]
MTVNLDPGVEKLPYEPDVDIRDWISLKEIMDTYDLGPNGAQIACADMLALNTSDIKKSIESFKTDLILIDTPGQLELFVFREAGKYIIKFLNPNKSIITYLLDPALTKNPSGFISQILLSLSTNFRLGLPQINILTKTDILSEKEIEEITQWSSDPEKLENDIINEEPSIYREMSEGLLELTKSFQNQTRIIPTNKNNYQGIEDIYTLIQMQFKGGEDLNRD